MKILFAILTALVVAVAGHVNYVDAFNSYVKLANEEPLALAQRMYEDESINSKDSETGEKKYPTVNLALKDAQEDIELGKKLQAVNGTQLNYQSPAAPLSKWVILIGICSAIGFVGFFIAYFFVYLTTKPLEDALDSIGGIFVRYFVAPVGLASLCGGVVAWVLAQTLVHMI